MEHNMSVIDMDFFHLELDLHRKTWLHGTMIKKGLYGPSYLKELFGVSNRCRLPKRVMQGWWKNAFRMHWALAKARRHVSGWM